MSFKTGGAYVSSDASVGPNAVVQIGITVSKFGEEDWLTDFRINPIYGGDSSSQIYSESLKRPDASNYSGDFQITSRSTPATERFVLLVSDCCG